MNEIWKIVPNSNGKYMCSNLGRIKSLYNGERLLNPTISRGYKSTSIFYNGVHRAMSVHRIVAVTFIPNPENKREVNHINGIKTDNRVENLEWVTPQENMLHARKTGLNKGHPKTKPSIAKKVMCVETGKVYKTVGMASRELGANRCAVSHQIARKGKCKGFTFVFV